MTAPAPRRVLATALLILLAGGGVAAARDWTGSVQRIVSGDTLQIDGDTLHLWGIAAPDPKLLCRTPGGERKKCGDLAREALAGLTRSAPITCERRGSISDFGLIAACSIGGRDLARELVLQGWALAEFRFEGYRAEEMEARRARRGLWVDLAEDVDVPPP